MLCSCAYMSYIPPRPLKNLGMAQAMYMPITPELWAGETRGSLGFAANSLTLSLGRIRLRIRDHTKMFTSASYTMHTEYVQKRGKDIQLGFLSSSAFQMGWSPMKFLQ